MKPPPPSQAPCGGEAVGDCAIRQGVLSPASVLAVISPSRLRYSDYV